MERNRKIRKLALVGLALCAVLLLGGFIFGAVADPEGAVMSLVGLPFALGLLKVLEIDPKKKGKGMNSQGLFTVQQLLFQRMFGKSLMDAIDEDLIIRTPDGVQGIKRHDPGGLKQVFKLEEIPEDVKQTMLTSTGTQPFMLNEAAADYFGGADGVFSPSVYGGILEGASLKSTIPKLWGLQPFKANELSGEIIYFKKPDAYGDGDPIASGSPVFARTAEGRAGQDIGFEVAKEHFDAQRYIVHLPYSVELQKVLAGRLNLDQKVMEAFTEAAIYRDEYYAYNKWYLALTTGQLEGEAFNLYTDGTIADVDTIPEGYLAFYNLTNGAIKCGDNTAYASATAHTASGADIFDLILMVIETMSGTKPSSSLTARSYRYRWTPDYVVVPQKIANKLVRDYKDGTLSTVWVAKQDIPMYKDEDNFLCRLVLGNKGIDVWVLPDAVMDQLPAATYVTTDSPTSTISPMYFGRYFGMAAVAPASPLLFFVDDGFEVVSRSIGGQSVSQLRRNMQKVHTMYQLKSEVLLNASQSFVVKVVEVS